MGSDEKDDRQGNPTFQTMPPELRPFVVPVVDCRIKPGDNPRLDAALAHIRMLDEHDEAERREAPPAGAAVHVSGVALRPARPAPEPPAARVEISIVDGAVLTPIPPKSFTTRG